MSISKYIEEFNQRRDERIAKNEEYIKENPYPIEELDNLDPESPIAKMYNENGEIPGSDQFRTAAATQDPALLKRFNKGNKSLDKIKQNAKLASMDANASLKKRYEAVVKGTTGTGLKLSELLNTEDPDEFEDAYSFILDEAGISGIDASTSTVLAAFKELNSEKSELATTPINEIEETTEGEGGINALNDSEENAIAKEGTELGLSEEVETEAETESTTVEPELEKEVIPTPSPGPTSNIESEPTSSPVNEPTTNISNITNEGTSTTVGDTSNINNINEIDETTKLSESSSSVVSNQQNINQLEQPISGDNFVDTSTSSNIRFTDISTESNTRFGDMSKSESASINEANEFTTSNITQPKPSSGSSDFFSVSDDELALAKQFLGVGESNVINEGDSIGQTITSETTQTSSPSVISTEITKNNVGLDKKIAPLNTPPPKETETKTSESVTATEVTTTDTSTKDKETSGTTDSSTNITNEGAKSETVVGGGAIVDMSEISERLRKIENLLTGPLDVKIID